MEKWKNIKEASNYEVSNTGLVRNKTTNKILKGRLSKSGYLQVSIKIDETGKFSNRYIHRLVAEAFIPNPDNLPQVNHKDGNRANNNVDNLEWVTCSQNTKHSYDVLNHGHWAYQIICNETGEMFNSVKEAAIHYNVAAPQLSNVLSGTGHCKTAKGLTFSFIERHYLRN